MNEYKNNLLDVYRNYLFAIQERIEYGDKYGDTDFIIEMYENKLNIKDNENMVLRKVKEKFIKP